MAMHNILLQSHVMVGCDFHIPYPPPVGTPLPFPSPYVTIQIMGNPVSLTKLHTTTVDDWYNKQMCKGSDIGFFIPHVGTPSIIIVIEMAFSGSKCHFGPHSVQVRDQYGATQNPACALAWVANPNLNCGFPVPTPTGVVFAFNTVAEELTAGDIWGGLYGMISDIVIQTIINLVSFIFVGRAGSAIARRVAPRLVAVATTRAAARRAARQAWKAAGKTSPLSHYMRREMAKATTQMDHIALAGENVIGFGVGSPLGTDATALGGPTAHSATDALLHWAGLPTSTDVQQSVDGSSDADASSTPNATSDYLNDSSVEDVGDSPSE